MRALPVVLLLVIAAPAFADPAPPAKPITPPALARPIAEPVAEEPPEPPRRRVDYRWQILVTDGAAIAMSLAIDRLVSGGGGHPGAAATLTMGSYFFSAPLIHGIHRQGLRALGSFALRAGVPLMLGLLGQELDGTPACDHCDDELRSDGKVIGLTVGVLIAMAVDGVLLARPIYKRTERPRAAWTPTVRGLRGGATAGVLATF